MRDDHPSQRGLVPYFDILRGLGFERRWTTTEGMNGDREVCLTLREGRRIVSVRLVDGMGPHGRRVFKGGSALHSFRAEDDPSQEEGNQDVQGTEFKDRWDMLFAVIKERHRDDSKWAQPFSLPSERKGIDA